MNHLISRNFAMVALVFVAASSAAAQAAPPAGGGVGRGGRLGQPPAARVALERQVRQALAKVTRRQLGLNDAQMIKLRQVDMRFEQQRRALVQEQRDNRLALRAIMQDTAGVDQAKVSEHMDKLLQLERRRIDVLEAEQKELGTFLTPLQRAKYQALQENVRRRLEAMRAGAVPADSELGITPPAGRAGRAGLRRRPPVTP